MSSHTSHLAAYANLINLVILLNSEHELCINSLIAAVLVVVTIAISDVKQRVVLPAVITTLGSKLTLRTT